MLVDGKRLIPANGTGVVDLNIIPASLIESVEIITGGASAVYGSAALAGVVMMIDDATQVAVVHSTRCLRNQHRDLVELATARPPRGVDRSDTNSKR